MQIRYQKEIKSMLFKKLCDPNEAARYFLIYIHNLFRQYITVLEVSNGLFAKAPMSGRDAWLCKKIIAEYKHEVKGKGPILGLIACLKNSKEFLEKDGVVAGMLSALFSYFPEYVPNEIASKLKLDFAWAEEFCSLNRDMDKSISTLDSQSEAEEKKEISETQKQHKFTVDEAFAKLEYDGDSSDQESDDEEEAIKSLVHAIGSHPHAEAKVIIDRLLTKIPSNVEDSKESYDKNTDVNALLTITEALQENRVPKEIAPPLVKQVIDKLPALFKYIEAENYRRFNVYLETFTAMSELLAPQDMKKIIEFLGVIPEEKFKEIVRTHIDPMINLYNKFVDKVDSYTFNKMMIQILKHPSILIKSNSLLKKIVYLEPDNELDARLHWIRRGKIFDILVEGLKLYTSCSIQTGSVHLMDVACNALCAVIPAMPLHERIRLTREIMILDVPNCLTKNVIRALHDINQSEKIVREVAGLNSDLARVIVKAGR